MQEKFCLSCENPISECNRIAACSKEEQETGVCSTCDNTRVFGEGSMEAPCWACCY